MDTVQRTQQDTPFKGVRANIVQSIRAHRVSDLQEAAQKLGHHFLYATLGDAQSKQDVLDMIGAQFTLPTHFGKNFDALYDCMTDPLHKSGPQPGFVVVLEQIPTNVKFDKEAREQLLDIFRDTADYCRPQGALPLLLFLCRGARRPGRPGPYGRGRRC